MKKILSVFLALFAALFLVGCTEKTSGTQTKAPVTQGTQGTQGGSQGTQGTQGTQGGNQSSIPTTTKTAEEIKAELLTEAQERLVDSVANDEASQVRVEYKFGFALYSSDINSLSAADQAKVKEELRSDDSSIIAATGVITVVFEIDLETKSIGLGLYVDDILLSVSDSEDEEMAEAEKLFLISEQVGKPGDEDYQPAEYVTSLALEIYLDQLSQLTIKASESFRPLLLNCINTFMHIDKIPETDDQGVAKTDENGQVIYIDDQADIEDKEMALGSINMFFPARVKPENATEEPAEQPYLFLFDIEEWAKAPEALGENPTDSQKEAHALQAQKNEIYNTVVNTVGLIPTSVKDVYTMVTGLVEGLMSGALDMSDLFGGEGEDDEPQEGQLVQGTEPEGAEGTEPEGAEGAEGEEEGEFSIASILNMVFAMVGIPMNVEDDEVNVVLGGLAQLGTFAFNKAEIKETATGYALDLEVDFLADHLSEEDERTLVEAIPELFSFEDDEPQEGQLVQGTEPEGTEPEGTEGEEEDDDNFHFEELGLKLSAELNFAEGKFVEFTTDFEFGGTSKEDGLYYYAPAEGTEDVLVTVTNTQTNMLKIQTALSYSNELEIVNPISETMKAGEDYVDLTAMFGSLIDMLIMKATAKQIEGPVVAPQGEGQPA